MNKSEQPFVHLISSPYGYYIFDVNTNSILKTSRKVFKYLHDEQNNIQNREYDTNEIEHIISKLKNEGFLSSKRPKEIIHPKDKYLEYYLTNKVRKITLQLTQKCNFRCTYCVYSENDNELQRSHSTGTMSWDIAKRSIDFLFDHSSACEEVNIGFYGGEPLLEFELLKKCVEYAEERGEGKNVTFTITTNGTLFKPDIIEYFIEHEISTMISLDGPKEVHDKYRRFAANGCGTFDVIEKKLEEIKMNYPEFFKGLMINVVVNPNEEYGCINNFFINYEHFKELNVRSSLVDDTYSVEKNVFSKDYVSNRNYELFKMYLSHFKIIDQAFVSPIALQEISSIRDFEKNLGSSVEIPDKTAHSGPCIPGILRLFINVDGIFYPCERVSEISEPMKIGTIDKGFDIDKIRALLNVGKLSADECKNCWAIRHCTACAKYSDNIKELSPQLKESHCKDIRNTVDNQFKNYIAIKEIEMLFKDYIGDRGGEIYKYA